MKIVGMSITNGVHSRGSFRGRWTPALCALLVVGVCGLRHQRTSASINLQVICNLMLADSKVFVVYMAHAGSACNHMSMSD